MEKKRRGEGAVKMTKKIPGNNNEYNYNDFSRKPWKERQN